MTSLVRFSRVDLHLSSETSQMARDASRGKLRPGGSCELSWRLVEEAPQPQTMELLVENLIQQKGWTQQGLEVWGSDLSLYLGNSSPDSA